GLELHRVLVLQAALEGRVGLDAEDDLFADGTGAEREADQGRECETRQGHRGSRDVPGESGTRVTGACTTGPEHRVRVSTSYLRPLDGRTSFPLALPSLVLFSRRERTSVSHLLSLLLLLLSHYSGGEVPQWGGFRGNNGAGIGPGTHLPDTLDPEGNLMWRVD